MVAKLNAIEPQKRIKERNEKVAHAPCANETVRQEDRQGKKYNYYWKIPPKKEEEVNKAKELKEVGQF